MLHFEAWKKWLILGVCLLGVLNLTPNFFYEDVIRATDARKQISQIELHGGAPTAELEAEAESWPSWLPSGVVNLGLDLQGGSYFLLEVKIEQVYRDRMENLRDGLGRTLREAGVRRYTGLKVIGDDIVEATITNPEDVEAAGEALRGMAQPVGGGLLGVGQPDIAVDLIDGQTYRVTLTDAAKSSIADNVMSAAIEVVRTRVDALGTREPTIQRQGDNRILMQLPGASEVDIEQITKQAKLEFRMVADQVGNAGRLTADQAATTVAPRGVSILEYDPDLNPGREGERIAVFDKVDITGDNLAEASQGFDQNNVIGVNIRFDSTGARIFGDITREYTGRFFAMVLDGKVLSAPRINVPIPDGNAIITGSFTIPSANALAVNLRSGNLPAEVTVEESSVVGPELGADSIEAGKIACIVGFVAVMVYMAISYGLFGVLANAALIVNVVLIFAALSLFGATLTLPGIAGIVLTIGMAVDANVLVFERIREELRGGRNPARAIETGYARALSAIIDANVTTFIAAMILFAMGSGPVRGFSVTLGIGIVTSVFTAVMFTRFLVAVWYGRARPKELAL